jgi:hypothetical protein
MDVSVSMEATYLPNWYLPLKNQMKEMENI